MHYPFNAHIDAAWLQGGVTFAILMELCRLGNLFKLVDSARKVSLHSAVCVRVPPTLCGTCTAPKPRRVAAVHVSVHVMSLPQDLSMVLLGITRRCSHAGVKASARHPRRPGGASGHGAGGPEAVARLAAVSQVDLPSRACAAGAERAQKYTGCLQRGLSVLGDFAKAYDSKRQEKRSLTESSHLCTQVAAAVSYMHANDVIHLDLTSQNLLVADGGNAKVTAFVRVGFVCIHQWHFGKVLAAASSELGSTPFP